MTEYRYKNIIYNYDDLHKAYRAKQLAIQSAIDCEDYEKACSAADIDVREYLPQIARRKPEQIETGDKKALTPNRKCSIIKAIKRHVRRWKQKQEGKTMKKLKVYLKSPYAFAIEVDGKEVYSTGKAKDIASYCKRHFGIELPTETRNYPTGTKTHFDGLTKNGFEFDIE